MIVLAGQRSQRSVLSKRAQVSHDIMVPVGGEPAISRVLRSVSEATATGNIVLVGPDTGALSSDHELADLISRSGLDWVAPADDPATSAILGSSKVGYPIFITTADHALLTPQIIDDFCNKAVSLDVDFSAGLVPFDLVQRDYPKSRRTVLRFYRELYCGANLYFIKNKKGLRAFEFWKQMQPIRKKPHAMARRIGILLFVKYLLKRLTLESAISELSVKIRCNLGIVKLNSARAAIDVDSIEDWQLAEAIIAKDVVSE